MESQQNNMDFLKRCLKKEVIVSDKIFSQLRTIHKAIKCKDRRFHFWQRVINYLYHTQKIAQRINYNLKSKYGFDIELGASIDEALSISHFIGIVIGRAAVIGKNFYVKQNVTIGVRHAGQTGKIYIGDNVEVGANSCIISNDISIASVR